VGFEEAGRAMARVSLGFRQAMRAVEFPAVNLFDGYYREKFPRSQRIIPSIFGGGYSVGLRHRQIRVRAGCSPAFRRKIWEDSG
jgi:hypothetical protein